MPESEDVAGLIASIKDQTTVLNTVVVALDKAAANVEVDTQVREVKVQKLEEQALALKDQTTELKESNERLANFAKILFAGFVINILALLLMGFLLFQFNQDSKDRSKTAAAQRNAQQQLLVQQNKQTVQTARCAITAHGNVSVYDACVSGSSK